MKQLRLKHLGRLVFWAAALAIAGCSADAPSPGGGGAAGNTTLSCIIPENEIFDGGVGRDGIPALTTPTALGGGVIPQNLIDTDRVDDPALGLEHFKHP